MKILSARMAGLIASARTMIAEAAQKRCVLLWSGGKDSMVLLMISRQLGIYLPVILFKDPWLPQRWAWTNRLIEEWGLTVYDWPPMAAAVWPGVAMTTVTHLYSFGPTTLDLPRNAYEPPDGQPFLCGVLDLSLRPMGGSMDFPWDTVLHGHKSCDSDPIAGKVPLMVDRVSFPATETGAALELLFPLRDWTDADVWDFLDTYEVPADPSRYDRANRREWPDKRCNPDWWPACMRCLDPNQPEKVACPRECGRLVDNISRSVVQRDPRPVYVAARERSEGTPQGEAAPGSGARSEDPEREVGGIDRMDWVDKIAPAQLPVVAAVLIDRNEGN